MRSGQQIEISVVVPVYRSKNTLHELVATTSRQLTLDYGVVPFEMILVDDASADGSWTVIKELAKANEGVKGITLRRNVGQHNAIMAGLRFASGRFIIIMDDDLQHPPQAIKQMIDKLNEGYDVCYTNYLNRQHSLWRIMGSWANGLLASLFLKKPPGLYLSSYKALTQDTAAKLIDYRGPFTYLDGLILNITDAISSVDIHHKARSIGRSNYNIRRLASLWLRMMTSFSMRPLRFASLAAMGLAVLSLFVLIYIVVQRMADPSLPIGWASLIATFLLIGAVQTACLGIIGEYVGRIFLTVNGLPQFVVKDTTFGAGTEQSS